MYYYIVDPKNLSQRQFERVQNQLYSSLSEFRISGETSRVTALRTVPQLVEMAKSHGAKNIIAVGNDDTLHEVVNAINDDEITVGFIPLIPTNFGNILGVNSIPQATKIIAARRTTFLDLGVVEQIGTKQRTVFLKNLTFGLELEAGVNKNNLYSFKLINQLFKLPKIEVGFTGDKKFKANLNLLGGLVINSRENGDSFVNPTDGVLDVLLLPKLNKYQVFKYRKYILNECFENIPGTSVLHVKRLEISNPEGLTLRAGNKVLAKAPAIIQVLPKKLKIIAGRERMF
ncbi:MAG: diacylglycerol kinase family protein [bacterium]|nr:diacylglycerol kinase family protein [bacterium]